ncbi:unnamed protein product, partial [Brassica rapa subsp. narinosa]
MDLVIIVFGNWIKKNKYVFNADSRGCRVLHLDENSTHEDFAKSVLKTKTNFSFSSEVEASEVESKDDNYSGSYDGCSSEKEKEDNEIDCSSIVEGENQNVGGEDETGKENEEDDEFDSRFDMFDDSDGASSEDDNFSSYGESPLEDEES